MFTKKYIYVYKSFSTTLDKGLRKNIFKKEMEKLENKLNEKRTLNMKEKVKQTNKKNPYIIQLFLNMAAHQKHIWSSGEKKSNTRAFEFFKKLQGNSDMHLDFKK